MPLTRRVRIDWGRLALTLGAVVVAVALYQLDLRSSPDAPEPSPASPASSSVATHAGSTDDDAASDRENATPSRTTPPVADTAPAGFGRILARVVDEAGDPVEEATVTLLPHFVYAATAGDPPDPSRAPPGPPRGVTTDAEGRAAFDDVPAGWATQLFVRTDTHAGRSATFYIRADARFEPTIPLVPAHGVTVRIEDDEGAPVPDSRVRAILPNRAGTLTGGGPPLGFAWAPLSAHDGTFEFPPFAAEQRAITGAAPEGLVLAVEADGYLARSLLLPVPAEAPVEPHAIRLTRSVTLRGVVVDADDAPWPGANVRLQPPTPGTAAADAWPVDLPLQVHADDEGRFVIPGVPALGVRLTFTAAGAHPAQRDVAPTRDAEVDLGPVTLQRRSRIRGRVLAPDGTPAGGAQVRLVVDGPLAAPVLVRTDRDGRFSLPDTGAAEHRLVATEGPGGRHVAPFEGSVDGIPAGADDVEIRLSAARLLRIEIRVAGPERGDAGPPTIGVLVRPGDTTALEHPPDIWLPGPQTIRLRLDAAGPHAVLVRAEGYGTFAGTVEVSDTDETVLRVEMAPLGDGAADR